MQVARPARTLAGVILGLFAGLLVTSPTSIDAISTRLAAAGLLPVLSIVTPLNNQTVSGTVQFIAYADTSGLASLRFQIDGRDFGSTITSGPCRAFWDSTQAGDGLHTIQARGIDQFGSTTISAPTTVLVSNHGTPAPPAPTPTPVPPPTPTPPPTPAPSPEPRPSPEPERPRVPPSVPRPKPSFALSLETTGGANFRLTSVLRKNGLALPGVRVTFVVTGPEGHRETLRARTNARGVATAEGHMYPWEPHGSYRVVATAVVTQTGDPVSATGSFSY